ncbi:tripartite tricarboxylate transporter TctB family protein [Paenibacillus sp.]|uniref:tripartite tricarboxylate transporter TctB family protein n=1 Tax=Paenibacillus sp. TaxID=58172 RepID=UPI002D3FEA79|nr:tripartite tricarboxylate transporter TctB family protein [Paenibacillus sp.]HZG85361.1 tripartite tricarboxylate transporter TctB family protein [Paenibacillus sp.]
MKWNVGMWLGMLFAALSGFLFWESWKLPYYGALGPGPGLFPRWLSAAFLSLSLLYLFQTSRGTRSDDAEALPRGRNLANVAAVVACAVASLPLMAGIGFFATGALLLFLLLTRSYAWRRSLLIALVSSLLIHVVFQQWLDVPLPAGEIWEWKR